MRSGRGWSDDELIDELRSWLESSDSASGGAYERARRANPAMPTLSTICRRFGNWQQALEEAGHVRESRVVPRYTDAELVEALRRWLAAGGDRRAATYSAAAKADRLPSYNTMFLRFGSWRAALGAVGDMPAGRRWTQDEVLTAVVGWLDESDSATATAYAGAAAGDPRLPSQLTVTAKFGSWSRAVQAARAARQRSGEVGSG